MRRESCSAIFRPMCTDSVSFSAADGDQISGTMDDQGHGAFTYYLLKGLGGESEGGEHMGRKVEVRTVSLAWVLAFFGIERIAFMKTDCEGAEWRFLSDTYTGPVVAMMKLTFIIGLFVASPIIAYQIWAFIAPGLYSNEKKMAYPFVALTTLGVLLGDGCICHAQDALLDCGNRDRFYDWAESIGEPFFYGEAFASRAGGDNCCQAITATSRWPAAFQAWAGRAGKKKNRASRNRCMRPLCRVR